MKMFDPTTKRTGPSRLQQAPRPKTLQGVRLGLVDNRKVNSAVILEKSRTDWQPSTGRASACATSSARQVTRSTPRPSPGSSAMRTWSSPASAT